MTFITDIAIIRHQKISTHREIVYQDTTHSLDIFLVNAYEGLNLNYPKFYKMDTLSKLGFLATEILLKNYAIKQHLPYGMGVVLSNAHASLDTDVRYHQASKTTSSPALFVYTLPNIVAGEICIRHGIKGENSFFVTPTFDANLIATYVNQLMAQPHVGACLAGWIDVMNGHHDVFLYLAEKEKRGLGLEHSADELLKLYHQEYGTVDGRS